MTEDSSAANNYKAEHNMWISFNTFVPREHYMMYLGECFPFVYLTSHDALLEFVRGMHSHAYVVCIFMWSKRVGMNISGELNFFFGTRL